MSNFYLNNSNYFIIKGTTVVFFETSTNRHCSKEILNPEKLKNLITSISNVNYSCETLTDKPFKFNFTEKRYQDRRKVERLLSEFKKDMYDTGFKDFFCIKRRVKELEIPVRVDSKTVYYVRESKLLTQDKWLNYFKSRKHLLERVEAYKQACN
jgi:hypothetical protein